MTEKRKVTPRTFKVPKPFLGPTPEELGFHYRRMNGPIGLPYGKDYRGEFYVNEGDTRIESWEVGEDGVLRVRFTGGARRRYSRGGLSVVGPALLDAVLSRSTGNPANAMRGGERNRCATPQR